MTVAGGYPIEVLRFSLAYSPSRSRARVPVLQSLDFSVAAGEFLAIVGPSGCGKTTLLKAIGGLLGSARAGSRVLAVGRISIGDLTPTQAKDRRFFGFAFQNPVLLPWRTVASNIRLPLEISRTPGGISRVAQLLDLMELSDFGCLYPNQVSGGMQQRANIARALVHEPRVLLLDEPFGSLDELTRDRLNAELFRIHRLKRPTILLVTHSLREATFLADRIVVFSDRPATIREIVQSDLSDRRQLPFELNPEFLTTLTKVRGALAGVTQPEHT